MDYAKLDALIEARRDEFLKDLGRWLSVPSVQGAGGGRALWPREPPHARPGAGGRAPLRLCDQHAI